MRFAYTTALAFAFAGCYVGDVTNTTENAATRDYSGVAEPGDPSQLQPVELHDRASWGTDNSYAALGFPNATPEEMALTDDTNPKSPVHFFVHPHTDEEGTGPLFNQRMCLGCHNNSEQNLDNKVKGSLSLQSLGVEINQVNTPVSRGGRQGVTTHSLITKEAGNPPTVAFTLYGDFNPSTGAFDPISVLGGPLQHVHAVGACNINDLPPISIDPVLQGGIDPVTGLSPLGFRREIGERAAPPYIGRGLMEAVFYGDIAANEDPSDLINTASSLDPQPDPNICPNDCISGRHNESPASISFVGGDPEIRLGRFGLRAAGTTLLQFDVGGTQGEIGLTSPFNPNEQPNVDNPNTECDRVPDPELSIQDIIDLRNLIRNIAPPKHADALYETPATSQDAIDVQAGAKLFGMDLDAFRSRMIAGVQPLNRGDFDADHGIAKDRMLGCVTCHIPILATGKSPAYEKLGEKHLSNRWAPLFSDLLVHKNPELPRGYQSRLNPPIAGNINRDLGDYAVPASVTGIANGPEFRTPPLMGLGKVGPPFWHDARVYLNVIGDQKPDATANNYNGGYPNQGPTPAAQTMFYAKDTGMQVLDIKDVDTAILAAIEMHDLPPPPDNDYSKCPAVSADLDICSRASQYRGEARNVMEKFHNLTRAEQIQVVKFLRAL